MKTQLSGFVTKLFRFREMQSPPKIYGSTLVSLLADCLVNPVDLFLFTSTRANGRHPRSLYWFDLWLVHIRGNNVHPRYVVSIVAELFSTTVHAVIITNRYTFTLGISIADNSK